MAKLSAWRTLMNEINKYYALLIAIPNPTAEEIGEMAACLAILYRMEALEKKFDKS